MRLLSVLIIGLWGTMGLAGGLTTPFSLPTTQVMPAGIRSVRVQGITTQVDGWYNDVGYSTGVAEPFNQQLTYGRLLKAESNENLKLNVEAQLRNKGVSLDDVAGSSTADVNTRVVVTMPAIAYGVTDKWTLAVAVPIVYTNIDVETGFVSSNQLQSLVSDFSQKSRKQTDLIQKKLNDVIATELSNKGYQPLQDEESTEVGDVVLVAKYLAHESLSYSWALTNTFMLPTAHYRDINRVIDPTPGDGQFDWGVASTIQVPINGKLSLINNTGFNIQFADTQATRIPISEEERLSSDVDPGARRDLGDQVFTTFGGIYNFNTEFSLGGSYTLAYKERDQWRGSLASADRYRALGVETEQWMEAVYLQGSFSTVGMFKRETFPIPLMATLGVSQVVDGRNVRNDPLWSMNMSLFF